MTHRTVTIAGWLAMISAFTSIPMAYLVFKLESHADPASPLILAAMQIVGTLLFVAITLYLKRLLNRFYRFHDTDRSIGLMIMANIVAGIFGIGGMYIFQIKEAAGIAVLVMMVFEGVVQIQFGYKLFKLQNNLGGLHKPFCYLNMMTGVCVASLVLILAGVVVSAISDLMLATLFFNVSRQLKAAETSHHQNG